MEGFSFDIDGLLSDEEAEKLFNEESDTPPENEDNGGEEKDLEEETNAEDAGVDETPDEPEKVGKGKDENTDEETEDAAPENEGGSSPNVFYSSIANALKDDGIFPDLDDETIKGIKGPEDFGELFEREIQSRLDETSKRIYTALNNGVTPTEIQQYESTLNYLAGISEDDISAEGDDGDNLRKQILYNDLINRGFSEERAKREIKKSFDAGTDVEDAKDALDGLRVTYKNKYDGLLKDAQKRTDEFKRQQDKEAREFKKMVIDNEIVLGDQKLDQRTRQKVYDAVSKPVYKDPDTGKLLTQVQKFQKEQPLEFMKQLGLWFVLTDGGKDLVGFTKGKVRAEKHKAIKELERKITANSINSDGTLRFVSGGVDEGGEDLLLSDDWKVGF